MPLIEGEARRVRSPAIGDGTRVPVVLDCALMAPSKDQVRPVTPALAAGLRKGLGSRAEVDLGSGVRGEVFTFGSAKDGSTILLTRLRTSRAFIPALVCRDRASTGGRRPAELPAERWEPTQLESAAFNQRYVLMSLAGQDAGLLRELFSPSLIAWLEREPPPGFSFELNEGHMTLTLPGHVRDEERRRFVELAGEVVTRFDAEIAEEGEISLDIFDESDEVRDLELGLAEVRYAEPPETVQAAISRAKVRASRKPAVLGKALLWGVIAGAGAAGVGFAAVGPGGALAGAVLLGLPATYVGWLVSRADYRWGKAGSVSRVGLEGWTRGYAKTRGLELEDRWKFHGLHKDLPMPGFCDHVLRGRIPGSTDLNGRLLFVGDAAELRAQGQEMAFVSNRPLASSALFVELDREVPAGVADRVELPKDYRLEVSGRGLLVWRPVLGNLLRTTAGTDRFCERAAGIVRMVTG